MIDLKIGDELKSKDGVFAIVEYIRGCAVVYRANDSLMATSITQFLCEFKPTAITKLRMVG